MTEPRTNDNLSLSPRTTFDGPSLAFDFPGLQIGVAEYDEGPTGCTVLLFTGPGIALTSLDLRGGSIGFVGDYPVVDAICLAGGSLLGLEAAAGVSAEIWAQRNYSPGWMDLPAVSGAIIYDYVRQNSVYPDKALGRAAVRAARPGIFPLGARGAGRSATCGKLFGGGEASGQGAAFLELGPAKVAVFTVVNAVGAIIDRDGRTVRGNLDARSGERLGALDLVRSRFAGGLVSDVPAGGNTTLTVLVTNITMSSFALRQLGREVHSSMSRAIQPFHTATDGDVFYTVSTGQVDGQDHLIQGGLGVLASELVWDAVLAAIPRDSDGA
jgi:L-aminopeptidase/D-esterase-like protein